MHNTNVRLGKQLFGALAFVIWGSMVATPAAHAQTKPLIDFPFINSLNPSTVDSSVSSFSLTFASGTNPGNQPIINDDGFGPLLNFYPSLNSTDAASALANDSFFSLTLNSSGTPFALSNLSFFVGKGGDSDPRGYFVRSSVDGFASDLIGETLPSGTQQAPYVRTVDLSAPIFQTENSIMLRFYGFTPDPTGNSVDFADLSVNTNATAPEPGSLTLSAFGLLGVAGIVRRRTRPTATLH